ncbi:MAG: spore coat biosynthesis protein F [Alphaproteobacteria bacterium]|nr:spore coat biosynthesis protein F [Alphaproteobacteria bacterium]
MTRVVASIEARMNSSRLPGKVLADLDGRPALARLTDRLKRCRRLDAIVIATTGSKADDAIAALALAEGVECHRGSEADVLARVNDAHRALASDLVVELTGDCPFSDPQVIDLGIETYLANDCDIVSTARHPSFPAGIDVQVFEADALDWIARSVGDPAVREHVSLYFYEQPERYRLINLLAPACWRRPNLRLLLDYPEDLELLRVAHRRLAGRHGETFGIAEIVGLFDAEPALAGLNSHCQERPVR